MWLIVSSSIYDLSSQSVVTNNNQVKRKAKGSERVGQRKQMIINKCFITRNYKTL